MIRGEVDGVTPQKDHRTLLPAHPPSPFLSHAPLGIALLGIAASLPAESPRSSLQPRETVRMERIGSLVRSISDRSGRSGQANRREPPAFGRGLLCASIRCPPGVSRGIGRWPCRWSGRMVHSAWPEKGMCPSLKVAEEPYRQPMMGLTPQVTTRVQRSFSIL